MAGVISHQRNGAVQIRLWAWSSLTKYVSKAFLGESGCPGTVPLHPLGGTSQQEPLDTNVPSGLVPGTHFLDLFVGILGARGIVPGWHLARYLCETRKALHERHVWKP